MNTGICALGTSKPVFSATADKCQSENAMLLQINTARCFSPARSSEAQSQPRKKPSSVMIATRKVDTDECQVQQGFPPMGVGKVNCAGHRGDDGDSSENAERVEGGEAIVAAPSPDEPEALPR